jgi:hypothetical protein
MNNYKPSLLDPNDGALGKWIPEPLCSWFPSQIVIHTSFWILYIMYPSFPFFYHIHGWIEVAICIFYVLINIKNIRKLFTIFLVAFPILLTLFYPYLIKII